MLQLRGRCGRGRGGNTRKLCNITAAEVTLP